MTVTRRLTYAVIESLTRVILSGQVLRPEYAIFNEETRAFKTGVKGFGRANAMFGGVAPGLQRVRVRCAARRTVIYPRNVL